MFCMSMMHQCAARIVVLQGCRLELWWLWKEAHSSVYPCILHWHAHMNKKVCYSAPAEVATRLVDLLCQSRAISKPFRCPTRRREH